MLDQEQVHLNQFNQLIAENQIRPTVMRPVWHVAGVALGMGTALLGREGAMMCTEAVETVIGEHYNEYFIMIWIECIFMMIQSVETAGTVGVVGETSGTL